MALRKFGMTQKAPHKEFKTFYVPVVVELLCDKRGFFKVYDDGGKETINKAQWLQAIHKGSKPNCRAPCCYTPAPAKKQLHKF